jgi:cytochrome P450
MKHRLPPGPSRPEVLGRLSQFRDDRLGFFTDFSTRYGEVCFLHLGPQPLCLVNEPALIKKMLTQDHRLFKKGRALEIARDLLGDGLLTSEGEHHDRQRRLIQPLFHRQMIRSYAEIMTTQASRFRDRWQDGQTLDLAAEMMRLTLAVVGQSLFDTDIEGEAAHIGAALHEVLGIISILGQPLALLARHFDWPTPARRRTRAAMQVLDQTIQGVIEAHRNGKSAHPDLVGLLLAARDSAGDGQGMSDRQIRDEALTLLLAGHETTANALSWSWYLLATHPRVRAKLEQEIDQVLQGRLPQADDLPQLSYTRQVLTEAMRLFPPAWAIGRRTLVDYSFAQYTLPAGCVVVHLPYLVQRSARWFQDPLAFRPERWSESFKQQLPKFAYFPFGGGPRNCIGEAFAWMEGILILATLAQRWRFELLPTAQMEAEPLITLRPRHGLPVRVAAR